MASLDAIEPASVAAASRGVEMDSAGTKDSNEVPVNGSESREGIDEEDKAKALKQSRTVFSVTL
jgi:predicted protein tyrosine phosphatase